ncbi:MAG: beta-ketoacyl-ACP synthase II [Thermoguttaceae bacterium]|nr:beta-ketoacyl-ACP synthase II [Thermoguttaceae bacterium]
MTERVAYNPSTRTYQRRRVVITGVGIISSLGSHVDQVWSRLCDGESGVRHIQGFDVSHFRTQIGSEVPNWSMDGYLDPKDAKHLDPYSQFGLASAIDAVRDSGLDFDRENRERCGVVYASGVGGIQEMEAQHSRLLERGPDKISVYTIPRMITNAACGHISIHYGLEGPGMAIVTACASASNAMGEATRMIERGDAEVIISGGSEAAIIGLGVGGFCALRALSRRNDDPTKASRPFDADRDGFVMGEGAGAVVLEELEHAKARGAKIYGEFLGYGTTSDGTHITQPDKEGRGAARAMRVAMQDAKLNPEQIGYINAHGTSTPLGDMAETVAMKKAFGESAYSVSISSTKSQLGHLLGASGALELIFSLLAIQKGVIPPTINLDTPDPECDLDYTPNVARERKVDYAMSNSFGFGGHNASLIVGRYQG